MTIVDSAGADIARVVPADWVGEHLYYDAKLAFLNVGRAELVVLRIDSVRGTPALHIRFIVDGGAPFYRLHNVWDSWIGLENFASLRFIQDHDEGGRRYRNAYEIFPDSGYYRRAGQDSLHPTSAVPLDDAAFFYFVLTTELVPGETYEYHSYFKPAFAQLRDVAQLVERRVAAEGVGFRAASCNRSSRGVAFFGKMREAGCGSPTTSIAASCRSRPRSDRYL